MNQNHYIMSQFTTTEIMLIAKYDWEPNTTAVKDIKVNKNDDALEEMTPAEDLTNSIAVFGQWFKHNNIPDDQCSGLLNNIRCLAMMFNLIPAPHQCPPPPPCACPHQEDAPPCSRPHAEDIPPPPSCLHPHHNDEDIHMELTAPTHAFSESSTQTPAPSHEASMPPPPPAAVASIPHAGP
ncbi:hypothetical protein P691DRAFT_765998 [Macrolepiota fuliginosa MF-IS2]|uniref:Uncharacterized protein n=1 Tax=Macrolepiota fuliginosa MF-IS2 TaxID=1400762 RepID=A0A9P5X1P3_9AGAR|nr:hypothetical protein P691DRAFT_765998 [Macrolepiota fuliginosa MF-IS2]